MGGWRDSWRQAIEYIQMRALIDVKSSCVIDCDLENTANECKYIQAI